jgi:hypothetical protein
VLQKDGTVRTKAEIECGRFDTTAHPRPGRAGEAARRAERLVLETVRVLAERFRPELYDVFHWPVAQIIAASGRMWTGLLMNIGWGVVFLLGTLLLLDRGSLGVAAARALGYVAHSTWTFGFAWLVVLSPAGLEMNRNS